MFNTYTITDFLNQSQTKKNCYFYINKLEYIAPLYESITMPCKNNFHEFFLVTKGSIKYKVDHKIHLLEENTLLYIEQGQLYDKIGENKEPFEGYILKFTTDFFQINQLNNAFLFELESLKQIAQNPFIVFSERQDSLVFTYFDLLYQEFQRTDYAEKALQSLLFLLLFEIQRLFLNSFFAQRQNAVYKHFTKLLEQQFAQKWSASDYAKALHISPRHLNRIIQQETNKNLTSVIQDRSILEAKRLLTFSDLNVREIATQLGFEDSAYFARFFRKKTNFSPTNFRKKIKNNT